MKKVFTLAMVEFLITGVAFAQDGAKKKSGKDCCKDGKECKKGETKETAKATKTTAKLAVKKA